ncbi:MAG TPA: AMP-binding protein [Trebonia sp.]|nr:AMP-binding protein [Trebonia sp.]
MIAGLVVPDLLGAGAPPALARRVALAGDGWTVSFGELDEDARRWQRLISESGAGRGDRVAILAGNGPAYLGVLHGASLIGAAVVLLNTRLGAESVRYQLADSRARLIIVDPAHHGLAAAAGAFDLPAVTLDDDHRKRLEKIDPAPAGAARPDPEDPFIQLYTSGTTGWPKGCVLSQRAWVASAANLTTGLGLTHADAHVGAGPFFHVAGLGMATSVLSAGGRVVFGSTRSLDESWDLISRHGITIGTFVGGGAVSGARHPMSATHGKSLRILTGQAGKFTPAEHEEMAGLLPHAEFAGIYGSTEAGNFVTVSSRAEEVARPGTIGRPLAGFRAAVVGPDDRPLPPGEAGELALRGTSVMSEYWRLPDATAQALRNGWLHTGDVTRMDDDGYLYLLDRLKDMVKPGGENVYSIEVEQVLRLHPAVSDCAVIGVPDDRWGEGVKAVIVAPGGVDAASLDAWCLERLAAYKRPRWYQLVDALPANGAKVDKKRLRAAHDPRQSVRLRERDR